MEQTDEKKTHELKTVQPYFNQLLRGEKTFELRFNDRWFKVGDKLALKEYTIPDHDFMGGDEYSGRFIEAEIIGMLENYKGVEPGYCILSLATTAQRSIIDGQKERIEELEGVLYSIKSTFEVCFEDSFERRLILTEIDTALNQTKP